MFDFIKRLFCKPKPISVTVYTVANDFNITPQKASHLLGLAEEKGLIERVTVNRGLAHRPISYVHWVIPPENADATAKFIGEHAKQTHKRYSPQTMFM